MQLVLRHRYHMYRTEGAVIEYGNRALSTWLNLVLPTDKRHRSFFAFVAAETNAAGHGPITPAELEVACDGDTPKLSDAELREIILRALRRSYAAAAPCCALVPLRARSRACAHARARRLQRAHAAAVRLAPRGHLRQG